MSCSEILIYYNCGCREKTFWILILSISFVEKKREERWKLSFGYVVLYCDHLSDMCIDWNAVLMVCLFVFFLIHWSLVIVAMYKLISLNGKAGVFWVVPVLILKFSLMFFLGYMHEY